jgi:ABC-2 type transport system permease protein
VTGARRRFDQAGTPPITLGRLVGVELRKAVDTTSGRCALAAALAVVPLALVLADAATFADLLRAVVGPQAVVLSVLGALLVTGDWCSATVTFATVPARSPVVAATLGAALLLGSAACLTAYGGAVLAALLHGLDVFGGLTPAPLVTSAAVTLLGVLLGAGYGLLLLDVSSALVLLAATYGAAIVVGPPAWLAVPWVALVVAGGWWRVQKADIR